MEWARSKHPVGSGPEEDSVSGRMKFAIAGIVVGLILLFTPLWWLGLAAIALAIGIPVAAYLMLDPSQRRRLKGIRERKQLDR